ncbi:hypothetical protein K470DRAFT_172657 [Piedraia hortae CBS 480.64]|uniref:Aminoglycoside phosphotransferase domain-containing protein n=1 Tax=Piedraia hortae CBS 480.64 TaxID=1314780 RepID=A0A6A7BQ85_9PEZI|nr:hypothetical protein K470DRAFT_172657 [Piedraia hortae CBS 480.64]
MLDIWERFRMILNQMRENGYFSFRYDAASTARSILFHIDLEPRNIMVAKVIDDVGYKIDKVIDWDRVQAVPAMMTRRPPIWLWDYTNEMWAHQTGVAIQSVRSDFDDDAGHLDPTRYDAGNGRLSPDDQQIRDHFENQLVQGLGKIYQGYDRSDYFEEAYGKGRWIHRIARFAFEGIPCNGAFTSLSTLTRNGLHL